MNRPLRTKVFFFTDVTQPAMYSMHIHMYHQASYLTQAIISTGCFSKQLLNIRATILLCYTYLQKDVFVQVDCCPCCLSSCLYSMCVHVSNQTLNNSLNCFLSILRFSNLHNTTYQSDMIIYGPQDPRLHHTPDTYIQPIIILISAPFGREEKNGDSG